MKKHYLILLVLLSACSADPVEPEVPAEEVVEEEVVVLDYDNDPIYSKGRPNLLNSYWGIFKESAALYGIDLSYIEDDDVNFVSTDLRDNVAGRADGSCRDYVRILIDETTFRNLDTGEQIFLIYHELGHDVFNASHDGGGLMAPNIRSIEYTLFQTEVSDFFTKVDFLEWTDEECEIIRGLTDG
tara:strand:- start:661 stop:1215 length:555 start_codon:yes stop_codon:yes gene_type:complete